MRETMLFYVGVLVPAVITVLLFIIFLWCLYRMRVRRKIMTKKYAPHSKGWPGHKDMSPPSLPSHPPPTRSQLWEMKVIPSYEAETHTMQTLEHGSPRVMFETRFVQNCTELDDLGDLASRRQDSGISEISDIHTKRGRRPYSQASSDSDDSGFRSSRSAHYLQKCDNNLVAFQDVPLLRTLNHGPRREEVDRSPISFTENIQITDYLAPTNVLFHPYYGDATNLPKTEIGNTICENSLRSYNSPSRRSMDHNGMASSGFIHLGGQSTTTTAMVHNLSDDNDQQIYSVV